MSATRSRLLPTLLVTGVLLAGAAACLAAVSSSGPDAPDPEADALRREVARLEERLGASDVELKRSRRRVGDLERRLADFGVRLTRRGTRTAATETAAVDDAPAGSLAGPQGTEVPAVPVGSPHAGNYAAEVLSGLVVRLGTADPTASGALNGAWNGSANGANGNWTYSPYTLIPSSPPFASATKKLGLDAYQSIELRRLVAVRDAAYANAAFARVDEDENGARMVRDVDLNALERADEVFESSVAGLLDTEQRAAWKDKGWSQRFAGRRPEPQPAVERGVALHALRVNLLPTYATGRITTTEEPEAKNGAE